MSSLVLSSSSDVTATRSPASLSVPPRVRKPLVGSTARARADDPEPDTVELLQRLAPLDQRRQDEVAQRAVSI